MEAFILNFIISCFIFQVWSCDRSNLGAVIGKWNHADCGLTSCTFLKSGKEVVVANQDGLVMVHMVTVQSSSYNVCITLSDVQYPGKFPHDIPPEPFCVDLFSKWSG